MNKFKKIISSILIIAIAVTSCPIEVLAQPSPNRTPDVVVEETQKAEIIGEIREERQENTKVFLKEDKSYEAAIYQGAVHYKEGDKWVDINNTLVSKFDSNEEILETIKNEHKVKIARDIQSEKLVEIQKDKYKLSWNLDEKLNTNSKAEVIEKKPSLMNEESESDKQKKLENITSSVEFKDIYENIDLKYDIISKEVKESIILNDKVENKSFRFNINVENLIPKLLEDKTIMFYDSEDTSKEVFLMSAPFMYDANGEESKDIEIKLEENEGNYILELVPSDEWINSAERKYPIVIDPSVGTPTLRAKVKDVHVSEKLSNDNFKDSVMLKTGKGSISGVNRTYISFELPHLNTGDLITSAVLNTTLYNDYSDTSQVNVHRVTSSWDQDKINWNNKPDYDPKIEDYEMVTGDYGKYLSWDITNMVKGWYSSKNNNGLVIKNRNEAGGYKEYFSSDTSSAFAEVVPQVTINYVNNSGLEDYWTYHSQDVGRAGTGYINDYNGNLVFVHDDLSMDGNRLPVSINHVFNSNERNKEFGYGKGWRLSVSQKLVTQIIDGNLYYQYIDADGTKHYFVKDDKENIYKDESGLDLTMAMDPNSKTESFKIKDKSGDQLSFNSSGFLTHIRDNNDNKITIEYDSNNKITKMIDGAGRSIIFNLGADNRISSITDPSGRKIIFTYTSGYLTTITYPDGKYVTYHYTPDGNLLGARDIDGYGISYSYHNFAPYRVSKAQENHINGTLGQHLSIDYGNNTTTFTDYNERKTIYNFNNQGNTVSMQDHNGNAQYQKYFENGGNKNKLNSESKLQRSILNPLKNHGFERDSDWTQYNSSNVVVPTVYATNNSYYGKRTLKLHNSTSSNQNAMQAVNLEKGKTYTLSGYIKTNSVSNKNKKGANIYVSYRDGSGAWKKSESEYIDGTRDWQRVETSFTLPKDAVSSEVHIKVVLTEESGLAYFDSLQLEEGKIANRYNLIENPDFTYGSGTPTSWIKGEETDSYDTLVKSSTNPPSLDSNSFKINGDPLRRKNIYQIVNVSGDKGDSFVFGGWAKGESVASTSRGRYIALQVGIERKDKSYQWIDAAHFNEDSNDWQYTSNVAVADSDYISVTLHAMYYNNANSVNFDGLQLYKEEFGQSYQYDSKGNVTSTKDLDNKNSKFEYDGNNDLIKETDPKGNNFAYTYDAKRNISTSKSAENVLYSFTHDSYGNPLTSKVGSSSLFINSSATYTPNGNYIKTLNSPEGNTAIYNYDEAKGNLDSTVDASGKITLYSYTANDQLKYASRDVDGIKITNGYTYNNDNLETITHNGFSYKFGYDSLGNNTNISVGTQNLITNVYEGRTSKLLESRYGNNQKISYAYDNEDRVISETYIDSSGKKDTRFINEYDASGNLGYHKDNNNDLEYRYIYDLSDRLTKIKKDNGDTTSYFYDVNNNTNKIVEKLNNYDYTVLYDFDKDDRPLSTKTPEGKVVDYKYDEIGRKTTDKVNVGTTEFTTKYSYLNGINGSTTNKISSIDNNGSKISYTYNKNGNIETITENLKTTKYYYNELDELKKEEIRNSDGTVEKTITYTYDVGGNILKKEEFEGSLTISSKTNNYTYGDTNWKDKLTEFNGKEITYDNIGNPLTYDGIKFSWEVGRQLANFNKEGLDISYIYNDDGIRTEKTVNGVTTKYSVVDGKVKLETNGQDEMYFTYDSDNKLVSIQLNGVEYLYLRNAQGDIIGLIDAYGNRVVNYTYDAWGNLVSIEGSLKDSLGIKNPYRYRGYRYDTETGLYYLQSRYYNPEWGRFINADQIMGITGVLTSHNLFAYGMGNPVNETDSTGFIVDTALDIISIGVSASKVVSNPKSVSNWVALGADVASAVIPGVTGGGAAVRTVAKKAGKKTYQTYTKVHKKTGVVYIGRTSGTKSPVRNVMARDKNHHMNSKGYGKAKLDKSSSNRNAIRGREQQLIEANGGARSQGGMSGNAINGISNKNKNKNKYLKASIKEFGKP